jgi:hypothetical protein
MTEVKNFDDAQIVVHSVVNQEWTVEQLPNSRPLSNDATHSRKTGEQIDMIQ